MQGKQKYQLFYYLCKIQPSISISALRKQGTANQNTLSSLHFPKKKKKKVEKDVTFWMVDFTGICFVIQGRPMKSNKFHIYSLLTA